MDENVRQLTLQMKDQLGIFHLLTNQELENILPFFEAVNCTAGDSLFNEGDPSGFVSFILSGKLEIKKETEFKGRQIVLATLSSGSFIGETALVNDEEPRAATAVALEDTQLINLRTDSLEAIIGKYPETGTKILKGLVKFVSFRLLKALEKLAAAY